MSREECEAKILSLMAQIVTVVHEYNPECRNLSIAYVRGSVFAFNRHWDEDAEFPIDMSVECLDN